GNQALSSALAGITSAVVGVIANLSYYFAVHTLFRETRNVESGPLHLTVPIWHTARPVSIAIAFLAGVLTFRLGWSVLRILGICAALGLAAALLSLNIS